MLRPRNVCLRNARVAVLRRRTSRSGSQRFFDSEGITAMPSFPGGLVQQQRDMKDGDCYSACVSMLTGIDLDILPVLPPEYGRDSNMDGWFHIERIGDRWETWVALMADNGYDMATTADIPADQMGIISMYNVYRDIGHAFAQDANGSIYNPANVSPEGMTNLMQNGWVPLSFTTITEVS